MLEEDWGREAILVFASWFCAIAMSLCDCQVWLFVLATPLCICNSVRLSVNLLVDLYTVCVIGLRAHGGGGDV